MMGRHQPQIENAMSYMQGVMSSKLVQCYVIQCSCCWAFLAVGMKRGLQINEGVNRTALSALGKQNFEIGDSVRHGGALSRILMPHPLHEIDRLIPPVLSQTGDRRPTLLLTDRIVNVMLVVTFPGVFL